MNTTESLRKEVTIEEVTEQLPLTQKPLAASSLQPNPSGIPQEVNEKHKPQDQDKD